MLIIRSLILDDNPWSALDDFGSAVGILTGDPEVSHRPPWLCRVPGLPEFRLECEIIGDVAVAKSKLAEIVIGREYDLLLIDNDWSKQGMAKDFGLQLLRESQLDGTALAPFVALYTQYPETAFVVEAIGLSARALVAKSESFHLINILLACIERARLKGLEEGLSHGLSAIDHRLTTSSTKMMSALADAAAFAISDEPILLIGEPGTGKELIARAIHKCSLHREHPFVYCNCREIPRELILSQLFGHVRRAFTGADSDQPGMIERAGKGTLFLDELHEWPRESYTALNRVTEYGTYSRVGGRSDLKAECRFVCAAQPQIRTMVTQGTFPNDLFARLAVGVVSVPPLRERRSDIPRLAKHLADEFTSSRGTPSVQLTADTIDRLMAWQWPSNVRELRNVIRRSLLLAGASTSELLPEQVSLEETTQTSADQPQTTGLQLTPREAASLIQIVPRRGTQRSVLERLLLEFNSFVTYATLNSLIGQEGGGAKAAENLPVVINRLKQSLSTTEFDIDNERSQGYRLARRNK